MVIEEHNILSGAILKPPPMEASPFMTKISMIEPLGTREKLRQTSFIMCVNVVLPQYICLVESSGISRSHMALERYQVLVQFTTFVLPLLL